MRTIYAEQILAFVRRVGNIAFFAAVAAVGLFYTVHTYSLIAHALDNPFALWDFKTFYTGEHSFMKGGSLYYGNTGTLTFTATPLSENTTSPVGALVLWPFAALPLPIAAGAWDFVSLVLLFWALSRLWEQLRWPARWQWRLLILLILYGSFPMVDNIWLGHWGLMVAALDILAWSYARQGAETRAGICLGLAVCIRWQPLVLLLAVLVLQRWRLFLASVGMIAAGCLCALLVFGPAAFVAFAQIVQHKGQPSLGSGWLDGSLAAGVGRLVSVLGIGDSHVLAVLAQCVFLASIILMVLTLAHCRVVGIDEAFSLGIVCGLLVVPLSWMFYHVPLLLPLAVVARHQLWPALIVIGLWCTLSLAWLLPALGIATDVSTLVDGYVHPIAVGSAITASLVLLYVVLYGQKDEKLESQRLPGRA